MLQVKWLLNSQKLAFPLLKANRVRILAEMVGYDVLRLDELDLRVALLLPELLARTTVTSSPGPRWWLLLQYVRREDLLRRWLAWGGRLLKTITAMITTTIGRLDILLLHLHLLLRWLGLLCLLLPRSILLRLHLLLLYLIGGVG